MDVVANLLMQNDLNRRLIESILKNMAKNDRALVEQLIASVEADATKNTTDLGDAQTVLGQAIAKIKSNCLPDG